MTLFIISAGILLAVSFSFAAPYEERIEDDPELTAGYFEGDMILSQKRNGLRDEALRWPDNIVYYKFFDEIDESHRNHILRAMHIIEDVSCIRFIEAEANQNYYINITTHLASCFSEVGWHNQPQAYNLHIDSLDKGCFRIGTILHELLHTLGFYHMQSASNRDEYVKIVAENIQKDSLDNFNKYTKEQVDDFGEGYDYGSVLHYSVYAFSKNGQMTIVPYQQDAFNIIGQRRGMSKSDINKLNIMYRCPVGV